jgi:capsular polysaccharide biosynthesis protein
MEENDSLLNDIGVLVEVLLRQWRIVVVLTILCALVAGIASLRSPKNYQASVLIASTRISASASFGSNIQTVTEEQLTATVSAASADRKTRLGSYVQLIKNPAIAMSVMTTLKGQLPDDLNSVDALLQAVSGNVVNNSDLIQISATTRDPKLSADIANAWGEAFVSQVNQIYSDSGTSDVFQSIQGQTVAAKKVYDDAQASVEAFYAQNQEANLQRLINEGQSEVNYLSLGYTRVISSVVGLQAQTSIASFNQKVQDLQNELQQKYADRRLADQYLTSAQDMYDQVKNGGDGAAASNTIALNLLKAQVFATGANLGNIFIQSNPVPVSAEAMLTDLNGLIGVLKDREQALDGQIQTLSASLTAPQGGTLDTSLGQQAQNAIQNFSDFSTSGEINSNDSTRQQRILALEDNINQLQSQLENVQSQKQGLVNARDLAWNTYKNLVTKEAELTVATQTKGAEVSFAVPAAVPTKHLASGSKNVAIAAAAGLLLGLFAAYGIEFWWRYKGIAPHPISFLPRRRDG